MLGCSSCTLSLSEWISRRKSAMAADRVSLMSVAIVLRSCMLRWDCGGFSWTPVTTGGDRRGAGMGPNSCVPDVCEGLWRDDAILLLCVLNISKMFWLILPVCRRGERDRKVEDCRDAVTIFQSIVRENLGEYSSCNSEKRMATAGAMQLSSHLPV